MKSRRNNLTNHTNLIFKSNQTFSNTKAIYKWILLCFIVFYLILTTIKDDETEQVQNKIVLQISSNSKRNNIIKDLESSNVTHVINNSKDKCIIQWTNDQLVGRCFGLTTKLNISTKQECQEFCCSLGINCITWQFWKEKNICKIGDRVRLGTEKGKTRLWCDSYPPVEWYGYKMFRNFTHSFETGDRLRYQCFGLGGEKKKQDSNGNYTSSLTVEECSLACRNNPRCLIWQASPIRGCYNSHRSDVYCESYVEHFTGGRKIPFVD